jgi:hypothetical protein
MTTANMATMPRTSVEDYEFQRDDMAVGRHLIFHSWVTKRPAGLWRIVAIERRKWNGTTLHTKHAGAPERWCDELVLASAEGRQRTVTAMYVRNSVQWRLLAERQGARKP